MNDGSGEDLEPVPSGEYHFLPLDLVLFGPGTVRRLAEQIERLNVSRPFIVTTASIAQGTPLLEDVSGYADTPLAGSYTAVRQHTPSGTVVDIVRTVEESGADLLISLGGGSVIDATKAAALALARDTGTFLPHISLPTTLSAAEFSPMFGVTDEHTKVKAGSSNPFLTPQLVILDVDLTEYTPDWLWFATGARAVDHAVETVYAPDHQPATDATALEALHLLFRHLPASASAPTAASSLSSAPSRSSGQPSSEDPRTPPKGDSRSDGDAARARGRPDAGSTSPSGSRAARQTCQIAAWLSFFGVANITLGMSHALGRQIGPRYNVPHGHTSSVLLPHVMSYLLPSTAARQARIAMAAGAAPRGRTDAELALEAPTAVEELFRHLGLPRRLRDLGVPENDLPSLAGGREDVLHVLCDAW